MTDLTRRFMLKATGALGASMLSAGRAAATPGLDASQPGAARTAPTSLPTIYIFLNPAEAAFIENAVARLHSRGYRLAGSI